MIPFRSLRLALALAFAATGATVTVFFAAAEPAGADVPAGAPVDGIPCQAMEGSIFHIHQHVAILDRGKPVAIPDDVGRPVVGNCFYWIHTHTPDGVVHVEAPVFRTFLLGQFFDIWGQPLSATAVGPVRVAKGALRVYVDGVLYKGNPRKIEMNQHADITLEAGPPYAVPPPFTNWQGM